jgi:hypothetical protein
MLARQRADAQARESLLIFTDTQNHCAKEPLSRVMPRERRMRACVMRECARKRNRRVLRAVLGRGDERKGGTERDARVKDMLRAQQRAVCLCRTRKRRGNAHEGRPTRELYARTFMTDVAMRSAAPRKSMMVQAAGNRHAAYAQRVLYDEVPGARGYKDVNARAARRCTRVMVCVNGRGHGGKPNAYSQWRFFF